MSLMVIQNGRTIEVPQDVEAEGGEAVERYVREHADDKKKKAAGSQQDANTTKDGDS